MTKEEVFPSSELFELWSSLYDTTGNRTYLFHTSSLNKLFFRSFCTHADAHFQVLGWVEFRPGSTKWKKKVDKVDSLPAWLYFKLWPSPIVLLFTLYSLQIAAQCILSRIHNYIQRQKKGNVYLLSYPSSKTAVKF